MNGTRVESTARHVNLGKRCCDSAVGPEGPSTGRTLQPSSRTGRSNRTTISRSEEHTSELQSLRHLVCRLLLENKKGHVSRNSQGLTRRHTYREVAQRGT